jgi:hypothetical protein
LKYSDSNNEIHNLLLAISVFPKYIQLDSKLKEVEEIKFDFYSFQKLDWTLEHIFPQNPENNYASPGVTKIHNIGNLVILAQGDNTKLSNKMPEEKFNLLKNNLNNTQNLSIIKELIDSYSDKAATWNDETIAERAKSLGTALYGKILKIRDV